jgi:hypothetical protein
MNSREVCTIGMAPVPGVIPAVKLLAQMEVLSPFSFEATTQCEILDFVAVWGDLLLGSIGAD